MRARATRSVLIVEDEAIVAMDLRQQIEAHGYEVAAVVGHAERVIASVQEHRPDVVLMDVRLKGALDGVTLAEEIFVCEDVPVVFLSAFADADVMARAAASSAYGYLTKPASTAGMLSTLEMAIHKHRELRSRRGDAEWSTAALDAMNLAIVGVDAAGRVRFMNRAAVELTGWTVVEARNGAPPWVSQLSESPACPAATGRERSMSASGSSRCRTARRCSSFAPIPRDRIEPSRDTDVHASSPCRPPRWRDGRSSDAL
jgi:CheY-like chemotaxis protein